MAEARRLLTDVTRAFVDRAPIDWSTLLSRSIGAADRAFLESLRLLDTIRSETPGPQCVPDQRTPSNLLAALVAALAGLQVLGTLAVFTVASIGGLATLERTPHVALALAFTGGSLLLASMASGDPRSLFLIAFYVSIASAFARATSGALPETWSVPVERITTCIAPEALAPACMWQFALDFPRVRRFTAFDVLARRAANGVWLVGLALFFGNLAVSCGGAGAGPLAVLHRDHPDNLFWRVFVFTLAAPIATILVRSRRAPLSERRKVEGLAMVIALCSAPFLASSLARLVVPDIERWFDTTSWLDRLWLDGLLVTALALMPVLGSLVVATDRPFELPRIPTLSPRVMARHALTLIAVAPLVGFLLTLYRLRHVPMAQIFTATVLAIAACAATGLLLLLMRRRVFALFDLSGSPSGVDANERLTRALQRVRVARGTREISAVLERELLHGLGARTVRLLARTQEGGFIDASRGIQLLSDSSLIVMLREAAGPIDLSPEGPLRRLLPRRDREWVAAHDVALAAPIEDRLSVLTALVLAGPKRDGVRFDRRDRWLLTTLTTATATALEATASGSDDGAGGGSVRSDNTSEAAFECPACGEVADSSHVPCDCRVVPVLASLPRDLGGKFRVQRRLGAGGMGIVYLARDTALDRDVALKTLPELAPRRVARMRDEARAMAALNHESLATIYGLELWHRTPVLVVEYFPGGTLAQRMAHAPLSIDATMALGVSLSRALDYMHERGMLHRDLKPSNIAFTATGAPKLLDFGLVTWTQPAVAGESQTGAGRLVAGTPAYLPPEAQHGEVPTSAFDLWALSLVLLEAMTGRRGTLSALPTASPGLSAFFERALDPRPELRFASARELQSALERLTRA